MEYCVYILFSEKLGKHYVGYTSLSVEERVAYHNGNHSGYTSKAKDWLCMWKCVLFSKKEALQLEKRIKKRGAKRFVEDVAFG